MKFAHRIVIATNAGDFCMPALRTLAVSAALFGSLAAHAAPVVDQSFVPGPAEIWARVGFLGASFEAKVFQSFSVGIAGVLSSVDVFLDSNGTPTDDLILDIVSTASPLGAALASMNVSPAGVPVTPGFVSFDLSAANLAVSLGDQLSIRLSSTQDFTGNVNEYVAYGNALGGYAGGQGQHWFNPGGFQNYGWDFYFKTYVDTGAAPMPAPSTILLLAAALAGLGMARRRAAC